VTLMDAPIAALGVQLEATSLPLEREMITVFCRHANDPTAKLKL